MFHYSKKFISSDDERQDKSYINNVQLKDQYCQVFYDKLTYIFIEMVRFEKGEDELKTHFDKWLYFLKHLEEFENIPHMFSEEIFLINSCFHSLSN